MSETVTTPTLDEIIRAPKVQLHSHLDGALRPETLIELSKKAGLTLPETDPERLRKRFRANADSGSLVKYLEAFDATVAVMQTPGAIHRIAAEYVQDRAAEGIVYAEVRLAPEQHRKRGLMLEQVVDALLAGVHDGERKAAAAGRKIRVGVLLDAMRQNPDSAVGLRVAELAVANRDAGVVGFDIAGPELGFPADSQRNAFAYLREHKMPFTIHAGEADGVASIATALQLGARRLGHGVRIIEDIDLSGSEPRLGVVAQQVRDNGIVLEMCPTSNVQTHAIPMRSMADYPFRMLDQLGFAVTINCDNELVSDVSLPGEVQLMCRECGYGLRDVQRFTENAALGAFLSDVDKAALLATVTAAGGV